MWLCALLGKPGTQRGQVILVVLEGATCEYLPGNPLSRHLGEAVRVGQVVIGEGLCGVQQGGVCLLFVLDNGVERSVFLVLVDHFVASISRQFP